MINVCDALHVRCEEGLKPQFRGGCDTEQQHKSRVLALQRKAGMPTIVLDLYAPASLRSFKKMRTHVTAIVNAEGRILIDSDQLYLRKQLV